MTIAARASANENPTTTANIPAHMSRSLLEVFDVGEVDLRSLVRALVRTIEMPVVGVDAGSEKRLPA